MLESMIAFKSLRLDPPRRVERSDIRYLIVANGAGGKDRNQLRHNIHLMPIGIKRIALAKKRTFRTKAGSIYLTHSLPEFSWTSPISIGNFVLESSPYQHVQNVYVKVPTNSQGS
jgi:hypothetical protein